MYYTFDALLPENHAATGHHGGTLWTAMDAERLPRGHRRLVESAGPEGG